MKARGLPEGTARLENRGTTDGRAGNDGLLGGVRFLTSSRRDTESLLVHGLIGRRFAAVTIPGGEEAGSFAEELPHWGFPPTSTCSPGTLFLSHTFAPTSGHLNTGRENHAIAGRQTEVRVLPRWRATATRSSAARAAKGRLIAWFSLRSFLPQKIDLPWLARP